MKRADLLASLDIGSSIKRLREKRGLSQEELAKGICDRTNITKLENGHSKIPSLSFILLICDRLDITIEEFLNFSMSNNYSLNKKDILDFLMSNRIDKLSEYLNTINSSLLSLMDQKYYKFLKGKVFLFENNIHLAKVYLLSIVKTNNNFPSDFIEFLTIHEMIKYGFIDNEKVINEFYDEKNINKLINKASDVEYLYFINDILNIAIEANDTTKSKRLLAKEIEFINSHECYKYLSYYYKNKIKVYDKDSTLIKDIERKLFAIETNNKKSI